MMEGYSSSTGSSFILFRKQNSAWGLFIFAFLGYVIAVAGQSCEPYVVTGQSKCDTFLANQLVYISQGQTQASIQQLIYPDVYPLGVFVPQSCRSTGIQLACAFNLPQCNISTINNKTTIELILPCHFLCTTMVDNCNATFTANGQGSSLPNCALFPAKSSCVNVTSYTAPVYTQLDCPYPLQLDQDTDQANIQDPTSLCLYPCPSPQYNQEEYNGGWYTMYVLGFISFFLGNFMILTWICSPAKRRFPSSMVLWLAIACTGVAASVIWPVFWGGIDKVICTDTHPPVAVRMENAGSHDTGCIMQGVMLLYFALAANYWWLGLCIHLIEIVVLQLNAKIVIWCYRAYHIFAWGFPVVGVIIALATQQIAASPSYSFCFVADFQSSSAEYNGVLWGLYFGPSSICLILGSICVAGVVVKMLRYKLKLKHNSAITTWQIIRMLFVVLACWWLFIWLDVYAIYGSVKVPQLMDAINNQVRCSLETQTNCPIDDEQNYGIWWLNLFNIASVEAMLFVVMGLTKETGMFWWRLGKAFYSRDCNQIWANVKKELTVPSDAEKRHKRGSRSGATHTTKSGGSRSMEFSGKGDDTIGADSKEATAEGEEAEEETSSDSSEIDEGMLPL